jgi:hypothetical protein
LKTLNTAGQYQAYPSQYGGAFDGDPAPGVSKHAEILVIA